MIYQFSELKRGDTFVYNGWHFMVTDLINLNAINLDFGTTHCFDYTELVHRTDFNIRMEPYRPTFAELKPMQKFQTSKSDTIYMKIAQPESIYDVHQDGCRFNARAIHITGDSPGSLCFFEDNIKVTIVESECSEHEV